MANHPAESSDSRGTDAGRFVTRRRLGIAIGADHVHAALVVGEAVRWHAVASVDHSETIDAALSRLLADLPRSAYVRTSAYVALGPRLAQVKRLEGLPPLENRRLLTQLVRENAGAFFLQKSPRLLIPPLSVRPDDTIWGAAFDADAVNAIVVAVRGASLALAVVTPVARGARPADLPPAVAKLGSEGLAYLDAYNATRTSRRTPFAWHPVEASTILARRVQRGIAALVIAASVAAATLAPSLRDALYIRRTAAEAARGETARVQLERATGDLAHVTQRLNRIESFRAERGQVTQLLGAIAEAIPDSTAIVNFRLDSAGGSFTAIAPRVTDVLPALASVGGMSAARIVGSVTREALSGGAIRIERAAFRFQRPRPTPTTLVASGGVR